MLRNDQAGWLYAVVAPGLRRVKIGITDDLDRRFDDLEAGSPIPLMEHSAVWVPDVRKAEREAHLLLAHARVHREWFDMRDPAVDEWLLQRERDAM